MKPSKFKGLIVGVSLAAMLLVGIGSTTAQAQRRIVRRPGPIVIYRPHQVYRPFFGPRFGWSPYWDRTVTVVDPIAQQRESGYSDGHQRGKDDAKHDKPNAPESHKHYSNSHSLTYRQAFLQGYADGYRERIDRLG
jgi:hypothetical protein